MEMHHIALCRSVPHASPMEDFVFCQSPRSLSAERFSCARVIFMGLTINVVAKFYRDLDMCDSYLSDFSRIIINF